MSVFYAKSRLYVIIVCLLFIPIQSLATESNVDTEPKGAACLVTDNSNRVLLVQSYLTNKLSLPGGYIGQGETEIEAAIRETYEETGILVTVLDTLSTNKNRIIFSCKSVAEIPYYKPSYVNKLKSDVVLSLNAPHYGKEVAEVYLTDLSRVVLAQYRYQSDAEILTKLVPLVPASPTLLHLELNEVTGQKLYDKQLYMISELQRWLANSPIENIIQYASGLLGNSGILFSVFIVILLFIPHRYGLLLVFCLLNSIYSVAVLKVLFEIPRPYYILPGLQQGSAVGFSFPSGTTTLSGVLFGLVLGYIRDTTKISIVVTAIFWFIITSCIGLLQTWKGVHYPMDILVGLLLSGWVLLIAIRLWCYHQKKLESSLLWGGLMVIYACATLYVMQPVYLYLWLVSLGVFISTFFFKKERNLMLNRKSYRAVSILGVVILFVPVLFLDRSTTSLLQLYVNGITALAITLWIFVICPVIYQKLIVR